MAVNKKINGLEISAVLYEELNKYLLKKDKLPKIVDISIGNDFGGQMYSKMKEKKIATHTLIDFISIHLNEISDTELIKYINRLNADQNITGIMLQLPLPNHTKEQERKILDMINVYKDVDGLTSIAAGALATQKDTLIPCTPLGIETLLKSYDISLSGKKVAILNRSNIVGKPLAELMLRNNATPIICHSKTKDLANITRDCDIVVAVLNKQEFITADYIKPGAIVIDVGVHKNTLGKTVGDVNFNDVYDKVFLITPPIGAVGPMTICMLAYNSAKSLYGSEVNEVLETGIIKAKQLVKEKSK